MAYALTRYTGDGNTNTFTIGFAYRDTGDIIVKVAGTTKSVTTDYTFPTGGTQIQFNTPPANGDAILFQRSTSQSARLVDYQAGSVFKEADLDTDSIQAFNMSQEAIDIANDSITLDANNLWDAGNKRIINVSDPTGTQDAATKNYVDTSASSQVAQATTQANNAASSATAAANSATAASASASAASTSAASASASETNAASSSSTATTQALNSSNSATASANSATSSATSASNAATSATNAANSENTAQDWAVKTNGEAETGQGYSSKAWAIGGTGVTDTAGSGSAKEWATDTTNTCDGTEFSAKEYAIGSQAANTSGSAKQWAIGGGNSYSTNTTVDGTNYSAKYWAEQAQASVATFDNKYFGALSSDPTQDPDGSSLEAGDIYYSSTAGNMRVYNGTAWEDVAVSTAGFASAGFSIAMSIAL